MTTFYAIRDSISGAYLPGYAGRKGATWVEFSTTLPPRLFVRQRDAKSALTHWLEGKERWIWNDFEGDYSSHITPRDSSNINPEVVSVKIT